MFHLEQVPIVLSSQLEPMKPVRKTQKGEQDFSSCYGYVKSQKKSAVLRAWTELEFWGNANSPQEETPVGFWGLDDCRGMSQVTIHNDATYAPKNATLIKLTNPWFCEETTGVGFVLGKHIRNMTPLSIPTGIANFKLSHQINLFNLVPHNQPKYSIKFQEPLIAIYPISDLPFHVESYYDPQKCEELYSRLAYRGYSKGNALKILKNKS